MQIHPKYPRGSRRLLSSLAALTLFSTASLTADWSLDVGTGQWTLDEPLVGQSFTASTSGAGALEVFAGENAEITPSGSWTFDLAEPYAIFFAEAGTLALDGALDVSTDFDDPELFAGAVFFGNGGTLQGDADISIGTKALSASPILLGGVMANDVIDISEYAGDISVTNDNSSGSPLVDPDAESEIPLPLIGELDLSKSAVAIGLASTEPESFLGISTITGELNQTVSATALSVDAVWENEESEFEEYDVPAVTAAIAVGTLGSFEDGIGAGAAVSGTATSGDSTASTSLDEDSAFALTAALGLGAAGNAESIGGAGEAVSISGTATSGSVIGEANNDGESFANSVALAAGFLGEAGSVDNAEISATSSASTGYSEAEDSAQSASAALAVGLGGYVGELNGSTISASAESAAAEATAEDFDALAASLAGSSALAGVFESIGETTLSASSTTAASDAFADEAAIAASDALSSGLIGEAATVEGLTVVSSATAGDSTAEGYYAASASSSANAFGVGDFSIVELALSGLSHLIGEDFLGEGFGELPGGFGLEGLFLDGGLEAIEAEGSYFDGELTVTAQAGDADAFVGFGEILNDSIESDEGGFIDGALADASALAVGIEGTDGGFIGGDFAITASAGEAIAETDYGVAFADAYALSYGVSANTEVLSGEFEADMSLIANGGDAYASIEEPGDIIFDNIESDHQLEMSYDAAADADAETVAYGQTEVIVGDISGGITQNASAGTAEASTAFFLSPFPSDELIEGEQYYSEAYIYATAAATNVLADADDGVEGGIDAFVAQVAVGGDAFADNYLGGLAVADAYASNTVAYDFVGGDLTGNFAQTASGGNAFASVTYMSDFPLPPQFDDASIESDEPFFGYGAFADASADSFVIDGDVDGSVSGLYDVLAAGGSAFARSAFGDPREALAYADSAGIYGSISGAYTGEMDVFAAGGTAVVQETYGNILLDSIGFGPAFADASAIATGIGSGFGEAFIDSIGGHIHVTAFGGTAASLTEDFFFPEQDTLEGEPLEIEEPEDGILIAEGALNAYAQAVAVNGDVNTASVSAEIVATATGGEVVVQEGGIIDTPIEGVNFVEYSPFQAGAFAAGIVGREVVIDSFTGSIVATATPGTVGFAYGGLIARDTIEGDEFDESLLPPIPEPFEVFADAAFAAGIMAYEPGFQDLDSVEAIELESGSILDVVIGSQVHAFVEALEIETPIFTDSIEGDHLEPEGENLYAAAVYGATGDDYVELAEGADIIGDINLGGGSNTLVVTGDSIMEGNILASGLDFVDRMLSINSGTGTVDFDIESGLFTAVRTVRISDLAEALNIGPDGGIAPVLSQAPGDGDSSLLDVDFGNNGSSADVIFAAGSRVVPVFADGVDLNSVLGNKYIIVDAEGLITDDGALVDNSLTPFEYTVEVIGTPLAADAIEGLDFDPLGNQYLLTVADVKDQDGGETPGMVQTNQASTNAATAVMVDISKRAALLRSLLQRNSLAKSGAAPTGAAGPDPQKMRRGEWLSYVSAFGNIGQQDSNNGVAGFDYDTYGFLFGQEKLFGDQLILGLAGAYARTDIDGGQNSGGGDSDLYSGSLYANWFTDTWYVEGGFTYGHSENDVSRVDLFGDVYTGDYDSDLFGTWIETGYQTQRGDYGLEPYTRLSYVHGEHDGFTDSGTGGSPLTTEDSETDSFKSELGLRLSREWLQQDGSAYFVELSGAWEHEWADEKVSLDANYLGGTLDIESPEADRDALVLGVRGEWRNGEGLTLSLEYQPTISGNWYNHSFSGTLQYNW